ncbi:HNH endonuclease [Enterobacter chuandaensis]|uniref:HNH endonuclease n=1 Tax=Enterobacter chuandaensis TaxID=2497875 RepID=UPI0020C6310F|nr:HNH endonuclease [Enterobacter chuandaensis]
MAYYYAYHSASNSSNFDYTRGYGVSAGSEKKLSHVKTGDFVFVIQNVHKSVGYQLCGLYRIEGIDHEEGRVYPHRVQLSDVSKLDDFIALDRHELSNVLPPAGKEDRWDRFMNHFAQTGRTFQKPLDATVIAILKEQLTQQRKESEDIPGRDENDFYDKVSKALKLPSEERRKRLKHAPLHPAKKKVSVWRYDRNPDVVAEVLLRAQNNCECCHALAPFQRTTDGRYYLEVHHIIPLSENGKDSVDNAIALCPNCHRQEHYGEPRIDKSWQPGKK